MSAYRCIKLDPFINKGSGVQTLFYPAGIGTFLPKVERPEQEAGPPPFGAEAENTSS